VHFLHVGQVVLGWWNERVGLSSVGPTEGPIGLDDKANLGRSTLAAQEQLLAWLAFSSSSVQSTHAEKNTAAAAASICEHGSRCKNYWPGLPSFAA